MNVTCPECSSVFRVDPAKIPLAGIRARCSVCGGVIAIGERGRIDEDFTAAAPAAQAMQTPARPRSSVSAPLPPRPPVSMPTPPQPMHAGFAAAATQPAAAAASAPVASAPAPQPQAPSRMSSFSQMASPQPTATATPVSAPAAPAPRVSAPVSAPVSRPPTAQPAGTPTARPPINPFLANDPNQKAKRLARALISDIIAYFPDRHAKAKREGTLRDSFRDEIKKSYEEYVEQMGKEFAENTTHFQDALNDVLAGGNRIF